MQSVAFSLHLPAAGATELLGAALAGALPRGPNLGAVLYLEGELGAGKTTCVRSLLRALGVTGLVRSPTYTLVETYATAGLTCVHLDLYRLADESEVEGLGLRELAVPGNLIMIEWPEKGGSAVPKADVGLNFSYQGHARDVRVFTCSELGENWAQRLGDNNRLAPYVSNIT
jgi:tRNA threonylcarbamoyladenosine biosynthesis protein TsaE